jgi:GTPase SAR1 family protein
MSFRDKIEQRLKGLDSKQQCLYAWLCGVRALPFLSVIRSFTYWSKQNKQEFLYGIFSALDASAVITFHDYFTVKATDAAADAAKVAIKAADAATYAARIAVKIADAAAYAAYAAYAFDTANDAKVTTYATKAADAAKVAAGASYSGYINPPDWEDLLLNDIEAIKKNKLDECNHNINIYGKLWDNFQKDLNVIGCAYWAQFYKNLFNNGFNIDKQQLERHFGVPDEIRDEGAAAVGRYLERLGREVEWLKEARIIILGEKGAGKTSLARKLLNVDTEMPKKYESTEGVETSLWRFKGKDGADVNAHVWDFAGHSITHSAHRCFMSARCLYIYVYNGRIERDNDPVYWLEQIRIHGGDSPVLFLINEVDDHKADIAEKTLIKEYPSILGYYRIDIGSKDKTKLKEFRKTVMDTVCSNPSWNSQIVSMEAYKIKNKLREHFDKTKDPHITREQFDEIAKSCGASAVRIEDILNDLNTLGICLWYNKPEMEDFNTLVLNPDWITNGIYKIINQSYNEHKHKLTKSEGTEILKNDKRYEYPRDKVAFLFRLMKLYELTFFENTDNIFIPGILPIDMPDELPAFDNVNDRLTMSFIVEKALPPSITARIIVQRSEEIFDEKLLWRKGAVLKYKDGDTIALLTEESRSITVCVKGTEKTPYIASLRKTIKAIFDDYKGIKPDLKYEVLLPEKSEESKSPSQFEEEKPLMLSEKTIDVYAKNKTLYLDPVTERLFSLLETCIVYGVGDKVTNKFYESCMKEETNIKNSNNTNSNIGDNITNVENSPNAITNSTVILNLPEAVDEKLFVEILQMLEKFLESDQAENILTKDTKALKSKTDEARKLGFKEGWQRLRGFLSNAANITTIGTAISMYLAAHPEIPEAIRLLFNR